MLGARLWFLLLQDEGPATARLLEADSGLSGHPVLAHVSRRVTPRRIVSTSAASQIPRGFLSVAFTTIRGRHPAPDVGRAVGLVDCEQVS